MAADQYYWETFEWSEWNTLSWDEWDVFLVEYVIQSTRYVRATGGDNDQSGESYALGWATLAYTFGQTYGPGASIIADGTFSEQAALSQSGDASGDIIIESYNSESLAIFTGQTTASLSLGSQDYVTVRNLRLTGGLQPGGNNTIGGGLYTAEGSNLTFSGLTVDNCYGAGIFVNGSDNVTITDCDIDTIDSTGDVYNRGDGIMVRVHDDDSAPLNLTITDCTITDADRQGIFLDAVDGCTITGCTFSGSGYNAILAEPNPNHAVNDVTITGCTIDMTSGGGIVLDGADSGSSVTNVTVTKSTIDTQKQGGEYGVYIVSATGVTVNEVLFNDCEKGVRLLNATATVKHCKFDYAGGGGIAIQGSTGALLTAFGNEIIRHSYALYGNATGSSNLLTFYNNTVAKCQNQCIRAAYSTTVIAKNNIFHHAAAAGRDTMINDATGNGTYDYNCFYSSVVGDAGQFYDGSWYATLAAWQDQGFDANSIEADPLFLDAASDDYSLAYGSPCLAVAEDLGDTYKWGLSPASTFPDAVVLVDRDDTGWDIGAYAALTLDITSDTIVVQSTGDTTLVPASAQHDQITNLFPGDHTFATSTDVGLVE